MGKQTLYRTWPSVHAILFDALVTESAAAGASESHATTFDVLQSTVAELTTEPRASLLRKLAAAIHSDEAIARQFTDSELRDHVEKVRRLERLSSTNVSGQYS